jgi:hypothetical protein
MSGRKSAQQNAKGIWEAIKDRQGARADFMDGETLFNFPLEVLPALTNLVGAKKQRRLTEERDKDNLDKKLRIILF